MFPIPENMIVLLLLPCQSRFLDGIRLAPVVVIRLSTAMVQVPCHRGLCEAYEQHFAARRTASNWIRIWAWSARAAIAVTLTGHAMGL